MGRSCCVMRSSGHSTLQASNFMAERGEVIPGKAMEDGRTLRTLLDLLPIGVAIAHDSCCEHVELNSVAARILGVQEGFVSFSGPGAESLPFKVKKQGKLVPVSELPVCEA